MKRRIDTLDTGDRQNATERDRDPAAPAVAAPQATPRLDRAKAAGVRPGVRAVVFDLDGTLVDSLEAITGALNAGLRSQGLAPCAAAAVRDWVGDGVVALVERALGDAGRAALPAVLDATEAHFAAEPVAGNRPYRGIAAALSALDAAGLPLAVLSNKPEAPARRLVAALFPGRAFVDVRGRRADLPAKPSPEAIFDLASRLDCLPAEVVLVGDSEVDLLTAHRAGCVPLAVAWGFRSRRLLASLRPAAIVGSPRELQRWLLVEADE